MTNIGLTLFLMYVTVLCFALFANQDLFSPTKWFLITLGVYFSDIFFSEYLFEIYVIYFCLLLLTSIFIGIEGKLKPKFCFSNQNGKNFHNIICGKIEHSYSKKYHIAFLFLLSPAIIAQIYLIHLFGGIDGYINVIGMRVIEFRGLGPLIAVKNSYFIISIIYFMFFVTKKFKITIDYILFVLVLSGLIIIGLLSGSRGTLLLPFVYMLVVFHYLKRPIPVVGAIASLFGLLSVAAVLSVARSGYKMVDGIITTGLSLEHQASFSFSYYGLLPLEIVLSESNRNLHYGSTFFTLLTNFVPRKIWPEKPDTGGVVLTKEYTGDAWGGASNLATGIISENVINFGDVGIVTGIIMLIIMIAFSIKYYKKVLLRMMTDQDIMTSGFSFLYYFTIVRMMPSYLFAEFTSASMKLILNLIVIWVVHIFIRLAIRPKKMIIQ